MQRTCLNMQILNHYTDYKLTRLHSSTGVSVYLQYFVYFVYGLLVSNDPNHLIQGLYVNIVLPIAIYSYVYNVRSTTISNASASASASTPELNHTEYNRRRRTEYVEYSIHDNHAFIH